MRKPQITGTSAISRNFTLDAAVDRWLVEKAHKRSISDDEQMLRWWQGALGKFIKLDLITTDLIKWYADQKAAQTSPARANRYIAVLRGLLREAAFNWLWIVAPPHTRMNKEPKGRVRYLTKEEIARLLAALPAHQKPLVAFALATGLRQANCLRMTWQQIDLNRKIAIVPGSQMKNGQDFGLPLNDDAIAALKACAGKHPTWVFTLNGQRLETANNASWRRALTRAGISDYRWHDNRHTWASALIQRGVPLHALQALGGWKGHDMVQRYAHLSPDHLHQYAAAGNGMTQEPQQTGA